MKTPKEFYEIHHPIDVGVETKDGCIKMMEAYAEYVLQQVKNLNIPAVMPSLPDDVVRSKEQNERMREWFKQRTGLEDALLNEHMKKIEEMLNGNGA